MSGPESAGQDLSLRLELAQGLGWDLRARDPQSESLLHALARAMDLFGPRTESSEPSVDLLRAELSTTRAAKSGQRSAAAQTWLLSTQLGQHGIALNLMQVSAHLARAGLQQGALLLHGGLVEREGFGLVLAGPGDVGKSTACARLPPPWQALSDDLCLLQRAADGRWRAHPWPTWSRYLHGGDGGSWEVARSVPLRALCVLEQSADDRLLRLGSAQAICLGMALAEQAAMPQVHVDADLEDSTSRLQRFGLVSDLATSLPWYRLRLSLGGSFWTLLEDELLADKGAGA